ncbi:hypothetical protein [Hypericibacter sp.]|uniref:hypothetical protein n=1 Tax=Hypericibacter sp. TaxID=2705401 RepID=UPI003D6C891D
MGAIVNHPAIVKGSVQTIANLHAVLAEECARSIQGLEEIILRLKTIDSLDPSIGLVPAIAGYEQVIGVLADIDQTAMPEATKIDDLARLVRVLSDTIATACTIVQSRTEAASEPSS